MNKVKNLVNKFNERIIKQPIITYIYCVIILVILVIIFGTPAGILLWLIHPYFCYVLAGSKNRTKILWALLGLIFNIFALIFLVLLPVSKDGVL